MTEVAQEGEGSEGVADIVSRQDRERPRSWEGRRDISREVRHPMRLSHLWNERRRSMRVFAFLAANATLISPPPLYFFFLQYILQAA